MIKNGFLRFCDDPELACCRAERELGQLREKNAQLRSQLQDAERRERAAVEDMKVGWLCRACIKRVKGKEWCNCPAVNFVNGPEKTTTCDNFEWRGVKEERK